MEKTGWFHRGVELTMAQLDALEPLSDQYYSKGFKSYADFEYKVDKLLIAAQCPIDMTKRIPTPIEKGGELNTYSWQIDIRNSHIASSMVDAKSPQDAVKKIFEREQGIKFSTEADYEAFLSCFSGEQGCLQAEGRVGRNRVRVTLMIMSDDDRMLGSSMLHHKIFAY